MTRSGARLLAGLACAALPLSQLACASSKPPLGQALLDNDFGKLVRIEQLSTPPFEVVQRLRGKHGTEDVVFEAVVQLSQGRLRILGTTLHSARAFVIEQDDVDVRLQTYALRDVTLEPLRVLYDLHRVFFRGLPAPQTDGTHDLVDHDEVVREVWQGGHIVERHFHALDTFARLFVIRFEGAPAPVIATRVRLANLHYGYSLEIETIEQRRSEPGYTLEVAKKPTR